MHGDIRDDKYFEGRDIVKRHLRILNIRDEHIRIECIQEEPVKVACMKISSRR
jgi:hypothetical protein